MGTPLQIQHAASARSDDVATDSGDQWIRLSRLAAGAMVVWAIVLQFLIGELVVPVLVIGAMFGAFVPFLAPGRRRVALAAGILAVIALLANAPVLVDELSHPDSALAFIPSLFSVLAALLLAVSGGMAFRRSAAATRSVTLAATGVFVVGAAVAVVAAAQVESSPPLAGDVRVVAELNEFEPDELTVPAGVNGFWLDNQDGIRHTFSIREVGFEIDAPGRSQQRSEVELEPGVYEVYCAVPGHENMEIELTVQER